MLRMNEWMRLWGLDPKTGLPLLWSVWWPWTQSFSASTTQIEVIVPPSLPNIEPTELFEKPMHMVEILPEVVFEASESDIAPAVAPTEEPMKKSVPPKRTSKASSSQTNLDLQVEAVKPKPSNKNPRAKRKPVAAITPAISAPILPAKKPKVIVAEVLTQDEPKKLQAPILMEVDEGLNVENVVKISVEQAQTVAEKIVAEANAIEK